jgi:hypothetical protein
MHENPESDTLKELEPKPLPLIESFIRQQVDLYESRNLFYENAAQIMEFEPGFLAALAELLNSEANQLSGDVYPNFVAFTVKELLKRVYLVNPYLPVSPEPIMALEQFYRRTRQGLLDT